MPRMILFELFEKARLTIIGPLFQRIGRRLIHRGLTLQGDSHYADRVVPSLRGKPINNRTFDFGMSNFIAPNSTLLGDITLGKNSSVWFGATLKASEGTIIIGDNSQIQDNTMVNPLTGTTIIGQNVQVSSNVNLSSCIIKDNAFIGANASLGTNCLIEDGAFVAAGSHVEAGTTIPSGEVWAGSPAEFLRN